MTVMQSNVGQRRRKPAKPADREGGEATIVDPLTGRRVSTDDVDGLIDLLERLVQMDRAVYAAKSGICRTLAGKTNGDGRVRRLQGRRRAVRVELPPDAWDSSVLRALWNDYPVLRSKYLRIDAIGVQLREFRQLLNISGVREVEAFRERLLAARREPTACPRVTIEE